MKCRVVTCGDNRERNTHRLCYTHLQQYIKEDHNIDDWLISKNAERSNITGVSDAIRMSNYTRHALKIKADIISLARTRVYESCLQAIERYAKDGKSSMSLIKLYTQIGPGPFCPTKLEEDLLNIGKFVLEDGRVSWADKI